jgi:hypothetical protein
LTKDRDPGQISANLKKNFFSYAAQKELYFPENLRAISVIDNQSVHSEASSSKEDNYEAFNRLVNLDPKVVMDRNLLRRQKHLKEKQSFHAILNKLDDRLKKSTMAFLNKKNFTAPKNKYESNAWLKQGYPGGNSDRPLEESMVENSNITQDRISNSTNNIHYHSREIGIDDLGFSQKDIPNKNQTMGNFFSPNINIQ